MAEKDSVQIKKRLSEELPEYKFSVTRNDFAGGHSVNVRVLSGPFDVFANDNARDRQNGYIEIFRDRYKEDERINDAIKPDIDKMYKIIYDIGQFPSGYHGGPYLHWNFGSYSKPYEVTASKKNTPAPRPEKSSGDTKAEGELLMSFPQGWSLYKTTINKTGTDGKPLKLVVYNLNKTKELKNIPYDKFLEFKGEMLTSLNMKWGKFQKFEKWTFPVDTDILKVIIEKYYGVGQPKEETPTPQPTPSAEKEEFKVGDVYLDKLSQGKLKITEVGLKELMVHIEIGNYLETYNKVYARLMIERGDWVKVEEKEAPKEKQSFNVGDKFLMTRTGETFTIDFMVDDNYGIVYFDGLTGNLTKSALQVGLDSGYYKRVLDEEKEEIPFKEGDKFSLTINSGDTTLTIIDVDIDSVKVKYADGSIGIFEINSAKSRIERGVWKKVLDEEKEEVTFKVGDVYKDAYSKKDLQIVKIEGDTIFFTLNGTEYNVGVIIAESYLVNKIWTKQEPKQENEEEIKKAIAALEILADDGDEDARKGIEALKILLN
jgi:hypothetical protein